MFINAYVAVCGFSVEYTNKIVKIIQERSGKAITKFKATEILKNFNNIEEHIDIILASNDEV